jgi:phytoene/squalene synthetase
MSFRLDLDYFFTEQIIKKNSASFYAAFSNISDNYRRRGVFSVYAYCRYVDDLIDENNDLDQLLAYKSKLDDFVKGYPVGGFRWRTLKDTATRFYPVDYDYQPYYEMIEGQEFDAHPVRMETIDQLLQYCDLVAGSVGKMLLPILAPKATVDLKPFAIALGRAFQLTNILRDIGEDYRRDRVYLPQSLMNAHHYSLSDLKQSFVNDSFIGLWEELATLAERYYQQALPMLVHFPEDTRWPLKGALLVYRTILEVIRHQRYMVMKKKHFVPDDQKMAILKQLKKESL